MNKKDIADQINKDIVRIAETSYDQGKRDFAASMVEAFLEMHAQGVAVESWEEAAQIIESVLPDSNKEG